MPKITFYHNPRCSKSRQALQILQDAGADVDILEYLKTPPTSAELQHILQLLSISPRELIRVNEVEYRTLHLDNPDLTDAELINAMIQHPILIERPIAISKNKAVIGRPPELVQKLL